MELGISIPTPDNEADWDYVKQFVTSIISQLDIGRQNNQIQVGVATYRGILSSLSLSLSLSLSPSPVALKPLPNLFLKSPRKSLQSLLNPMLGGSS